MTRHQNRASLFRQVLAIVSVIVATTTGARAAAKPTAVGQEISGFITEVHVGGHFLIFGHDLVLADFSAPRPGEPGDQDFVEKMNRLRYLPVVCYVERTTPDANYARCRLEGRTLLGDILRQWNTPEAKS